MRLGYHCASFHFPDSDDRAFESAMRLARRVDAAGFEWVSTMDHLWQLPFVGQRDEPYFDAYTTLPAIARETESVEIGALVTCPHYRNPAMLGRQLTTLDHASGGRAVCGIGAGWFAEEYDAYGFDFPDPETRVRHLRDTVDLVREMWRSDSPLSASTPSHDVDDLYLEPKPVQAGGLDVMIGGGGEDLLLKAVADLADRWNVPGVSPSAYAHKRDVLAAYCERFGTDPDAIEHSVFQTAVIRESTEVAHGAFERLHGQTAAADTPSREEYRQLVGTPDEVIDRLAAFADRGVDMAMVMAERNDPETIEHLIETVLPAVR